MGDAHDERAAACAPGAAQSGGRAPSAWARAARDRAIEAQSTAAAPHSLGLSFNVYGNISTTAPLLNNVRTQLTHASSGSASACLLNFYDDFVFSPPPGSGSSTVGAIMHDCSVDVTASATSEGTAHLQPSVMERDAAADSTATAPVAGSPVTGSPVNTVSPVTTAVSCAASALVEAGVPKKAAHVLAAKGVTAALLVWLPLDVVQAELRSEEVLLSAIELIALRAALKSQNGVSLRHPKTTCIPLDHADVA